MSYSAAELKEIIEISRKNGVDRIVINGRQVDIRFKKMGVEERGDGRWGWSEPITTPLPTPSKETYTEDELKRKAEEIRALKLETLALSDPLAFEKLMENPEVLGLEADSREEVATDAP